METHAFRAMGTEIELFVEGRAGDQWNAVEREFERLEDSMSRFRPDSELSQLNRDGRIVGSSALVEVVTAAVEARERTGGLFDPTVHDAVVRAGYDRTFEQLTDRASAPSEGVPCRGEIDIDGPRITLAAGVRLDLGGIAKGYAVDRASQVLAEIGPSLVNAGGDIAVRGGSWPVGVVTAAGTITLLLERGAVATSGSDRRRWATQGGAAHHLIDPRTGRPADTGVLRATVVAASAIEAEVLAKVAFLGGEVEAPRVLVTVDGRTILAGGLE
jgi:thiamine biosynthesis lipoprotein